MIGPPAGARIWIAAGVTDLRCVWVIKTPAASGSKRFELTRKRSASNDDDGYIRDACVRASVSDRAAWFGVGGGRLWLIKIQSHLKPPIWTDMIRPVTARYGPSFHVP